MTGLFLLQLVLTFLVGTFWIFATVLAGLRFGSKAGGFIGGLPSTALLSFFFIGFTQSPEIASSATTIFPIAIAISVLFLVIYAAVARFGFVPALASSLGFWLVSSGIVMHFRWVHFGLNLAIYAVVICIAYLVLEKTLSVTSVPSNHTGHPEQGLAIRSVFGGLVVMLTVLLARVGGPAFGGIVAAFPAMYISVLTISYQAHGVEFSRAMTKPLMVTGMVTVAVYATALRYLVLSSGLYAGTALSLCVSGFSAYLTYRYVLPRLV